MQKYNTYDDVFPIIHRLNPVLEKHVANAVNGEEITLENVEVADAALNEALERLRGLRFRTNRERRNVGRLKESFKAYQEGVAALRKAIEAGDADIYSYEIERPFKKAQDLIEKY